MKRFHFVGAGVPVLVAALVAGSALAAGTTAAKVVPFTGKYAGTASAKVTGQVADIAASGKGSANLLGSSTITGAGKGDASAQPCVPFTGPGTLVGAAAKLRFTVTPDSKGCGDEGGHVFSVVGHVKVTGGTGKYAKARGTLKMTGVFDHDAGTFSIKLTGALTV